MNLNPGMILYLFTFFFTNQTAKPQSPERVSGLSVCVTLFLSMQFLILCISLTASHSMFSLYLTGAMLQNTVLSEKTALRASDEDINYMSRRRKDVP